MAYREMAAGPRRAAHSGVMPAYGYICEKGHRFELTTSMADYLPEQPCPECGEVGRRDWQALKAPPIHGGPTTSAHAKVRPEGKSVGVKR